MKYTIVVVNYNKEDNLKKCLDSIINQTYKDFEIIIVDDGSTDNSKKIIEKYKKYKNVTTYYKKNTGVSDTRNFAIEKVKTKYFMFVDSDDYIDTKLLEKCNEYNDYDILSFNNYFVNNKGKISKNIPKENFTTKNSEECLLKYTESKTLFLVPWGYIYNTNLFKKNNIKYTKGLVHEDVEVTTLAILNAKKIISVDIYGYYYVLTNNSIMRNKDREKLQLRAKSILHHYKNLKKYFIKNIKDVTIQKKIINYYSQLLLYTGADLKRKDRKIFAKELKKLRIIDDMSDNDKKKKVCKVNMMLFFDLYRTYHSAKILLGIEKI